MTTPLVTGVQARETARGTTPHSPRTNDARRAAIRAAARVWRAGMDAMDRMTVEDAARACWTPGGPSLDELTARITADRAERTVPQQYRAAA